MFLIENVDVVRSDVPFLIGLDLLDKYQMIVSNVYNVLHCLNFHCSIPSVLKRGHIYLEWMPEDYIPNTYS